MTDEKVKTKSHTITRLRNTTKQRDGIDAIMYIHQWPTGFQKVMFQSDSLAQKFADALNEEDE